VVSLRKITFFVFLSFLPFFFTAQNIHNEDHSFDCNQFKRINVPFDHSDTSAFKNGHFIRKVELHSKTHRTSDWYRIQVKDTCTLSFKITPINSSDSFEVSLYRYLLGEDFCADVYENKVKPEKYYFYKNIKKQETSSLNEKTFLAKKGQVYYLCIYGITINDCGHQLRLNNGRDTIFMRSVYSPCQKDTSMLRVNSLRGKQENLFVAETKEKDKKTAAVIPSESTELLSIKCLITDVKKESPLDSKLRIVDELTGSEMKVAREKTGEFTVYIEPDKNYKVECYSLGYKFFDYSVNISRSAGAAKSYSIQLTPLQAGNNFIMKNIYFHPNTYALKTESEVDLPALLDYMKNNPKIKVEIQGYTNGNKKIRKNKAYNKLGEEWNFEGSAKNLSRHRAEAIKKYLILNGITPERIEAKGFGGDKMIIKKPRTISDIQKNIRVEVLILEN
jgi:outer membrane protein OmpA-like peptidoglycan-associated protein